MPRVSVILPTYNKASLVAQAVESVLAQTYRDFEIVVVDDGSTDATREALSRYGDRIVYIFQENAGPGAARNTAIRASKGDLLAFLDHDDMMSPIKLACQVAYFDEHPEVGAVYTGWQYVNDQGTEVLSEVRPAHEGEILKDLLREGTLFPSVAAMVRRSVAERVGLFDETRTLQSCEDIDFWIRVAADGCRFGCIQQPLCQKRVSPDGLAQSLTRREQAWAIILHKVFDGSDLPAEIVGLQNEIYARRYVEFGLEHYTRYTGPETEASLSCAQDYFSQALMFQPDILDDRRDFWDLVAYKSIELDPDDPEPHLRTIMRAYTDPHKRELFQTRLSGHVHIIQAFRAWKTQDSSQVVYHAVQGLLHDPRWFNNRGVLSILVKSLGRPARV